MRRKALCCDRHLPAFVASPHAFSAYYMIHEFLETPVSTLKGLFRVVKWHLALGVLNFFGASGIDF